MVHQMPVEDRFVGVQDSGLMSVVWKGLFVGMCLGIVLGLVLALASVSVVWST